MPRGKGGKSGSQVQVLSQAKGKSDSKGRKRLPKGESA